MKIEALTLAACMAFFATGCVETAEPIETSADGTFAHDVSPKTVSDALLRASSRVDHAGCAPRRSTYVRIDANLDANAPVSATPFDSEDPAATSNFSTETFVYDGIGRKYSVDVYFAKTGADSWNVHAIMTAGSTNVEMGTFPIQFAADGSLHGTALPFVHMPAGVGFASTIQLELGFGDDVIGRQPGHLTQTSAPNQVFGMETDGRGFLATDACSP